MRFALAVGTVVFFVVVTLLYAGYIGSDHVRPLTEVVGIVAFHGFLAGGAVFSIIWVKYETREKDRIRQERLEAAIEHDKALYGTDEEP